MLRVHHRWEEPEHLVCYELGENDDASLFTEIMQLETLLEDPVTPCVPDRRGDGLVCSNPGNGFESDTPLSSKTSTTFHSNSNEAVALSQEQSVESDMMSSRNKEIKNEDGNDDEADEDVEGQCPVSTSSTLTTTSTAGSMTGSSTSASAFLGTADTTRATTAAEVPTSSFTSNIVMNRIDEEEALDRLRSDLSQDEVSMLIGIFGPTKQRDARLPAEPHPVTENMKSGYDSIPVSRHFDSPQRLPRSLSLFLHYHPVHHYHPAIERLGFNRSGMVQRGQPRPEVVIPTIIYPITQEANSALSNHPVSVLPMQVLGAPLSAALAKEKQMANKRRKKDMLLSKPPPLLPLLAPENNKTSNIRNDDRPPSLAPSPKKRAKHVPLEAVFPSEANSSSSSTSAATTTVTTAATRRAKVVSAKMKKPKAKTSKSPKIAAPIETYITHPKHMNEGVWNQRLEEAREFVSKHGHGRIPTSYPPNPDLANWAKRQRYHYKIFKKHVLDRLNDPAITPTQFLPTGFIKHTNGFIRHKKPGTRWIKCLMTSERLAKLKAITFCMDLQAGSWECNYKRLCDYARRNNDRTCPSKHTHRELWKWVGTQRYQMTLRKKREEGKTNSSDMPCLAPERIAKLNKINFVWEDKIAVDERTRS
jgi:hypothetical protein